MARKFCSFRLEELEDRTLPAGVLPWPVAPAAGQSLALRMTYGEFNEQGGIVTHAGIDIYVPANTAVTAIQAGTVHGVDPQPAPGGTISVTSVGGGWNYVHIAPGMNPATGMVWSAGDNVAAGQQLGTVQVFGGGQEHLHLDATAGNADARFPLLLRPTTDPLNWLTSLNDTVRPTVSNDIKFRRAADDSNGTTTPVPGQAGMFNEAPSQTHHYFFEVDAANRLVIGALGPMRDAQGNNAAGSSDFDIIASMSDQVLAGGVQVGVKRTWFRATGQRWAGDTLWVNSHWFAGEFFGAGQDYNSFYSSALTRVIYENDAQANSTQFGPYWYTLTNESGDNVVQLADRNRFWNSNVSSGRPWNDPANDAARNANAQYPDDVYTIRVSAQDEAGNETEASRTVVLANWARDVRMGLAPNGDIRVLGGSQYTANQSVPLYVVIRPPFDPPPDGMTLSSPRATATTDANGEILQIDIGSLPPDHFWLVADYNQDGIYNTYLDAKTDVFEQGGDFLELGAFGTSFSNSHRRIPSFAGVTSFPMQTVVSSFLASADTTDGGSSLSAAWPENRAATEAVMRGLLPRSDPMFRDIDRYNFEYIERDPDFFAGQSDDTPFAHDLLEADWEFFAAWI